MSRPRTFTRAEMMDAARAAAETGLRVLLRPGEIEFTSQAANKNEPTSADAALEGWLNGNKARGNP